MIEKTQLESLPKETLVKLIEVYCKNWFTVDGLWFRNVEDEFGTKVAANLDEMMWLKYAETEARRIKEALNITGGGFEALFKIMNFTVWAIGGGFHYEFEEVSPKRVILYRTNCRNQEARQRQGLDEFPCKQTGTNCWKGIAKIADPRIKVDCLFCPPDPHPKDAWCKWLFTLTD
jgi:hypothetical protein